VQGLYGLLSTLPPWPATKLIVGNTSSGIFKTEPTVNYVDISRIPTLRTAQMNGTGATFGAAVTLSNMMNLLTSYTKNLRSYQAAKFSTLVAHLWKVAHFQVRNVGCWAGNFMMAHQYGQEFPSDLVTIFLGAGAVLTIGSPDGLVQNVTVDAFLSMNMERKVILSIFIPVGVQKEVFVTYKAMQRSQHSHAFVNAAFDYFLDVDNKIKKCAIAYGGVRAYAMRCPKAEAALIGQNVSDLAAFFAALAILQQEAVPDAAPGRVAYRTSLVTSFFYKSILAAQPSVKPSLESVVRPFQRPVSEGIQTFKSCPSEFPVSKAIPKLEALQQTTGEIIYTADIPSPPGCLCAGFVTSTKANARISNIDTHAALAMPGVRGFISAKDITNSQNSWGPTVPDEQLFASEKVAYYGQVIGVIVADTQTHADVAARAVSITYSDVQKPIITTQEAIAAESYHPDYPDHEIPVITQGDVEQGFKQSATIVEGTIATGWQIHFHMEPQDCIVVPTDEGMEVTGGIQFAQLVQMTIGSALSMSANKVIVQARRTGGAFGAKITRNVPVIAAVAVAANKLNRPVRTTLNINTNFEAAGKRPPYLCKYKAGVDANGKPVALKLQIYINQGIGYDTADSEAGLVLRAVDNAYNWPNFRGTARVCKTNTPPNTSMRGPGWTQAVFIAEHIMEHIAFQTKIPPDVLKRNAFYKEGDVTPYKEKLPYFSLPDIWEQLLSSAQFQSRQEAVNVFNASNRWVKRGISIVPVKFGVYWDLRYGANVSIFKDGSVTVTHSGTEMGQGINTKVAQVVAMALEIPLELVSVQNCLTRENPNASPTGGSVADGLNAGAVLAACRSLNDRLAPFKSKLGSGADWKKVVEAALEKGTDLCARGWMNPPKSDLGPQQYNSYCVAVTEVILDVLTGQHQILRSDILFDAGISLNPAIDIGQVEGGYIQGVGMHTCEEALFDTQSNPGQLISNGTWEYKVPTTKDIPIDFRVSLLKDAPNPLGVLRSKAVGEPPLALGCGVLFALRHAIDAARADAGLSAYYTLHSPATPEAVQQACLTTPAQFIF
jgi:xanthine dehydrogenase/oxidase